MTVPSSARNCVAAIAVIGALYVAAAGSVGWSHSPSGGRTPVGSVATAVSSPTPLRPSQKAVPARLGFYNGVLGRVRDVSGGGLGAASVCIACSENGCEPRSARLRCTNTDENGNYAFDAVEPGHYRLWATRQGYAPGLPLAQDGCEREEIAHGFGRDHWEFVLRPGGALVEGVVRDAAGGIVAGAMLTAESVGGSSTARRIMTESDADGMFTLSVSDAVLVVRAAADGYAPLVQGVEAPAQLELVLSPASTLEGQVISETDRRGVGEVTVVAHRLPPHSRGLTDHAAKTHATGGFELPGLAPGDYELLVRSPGWLSEAPARVRVGVGDTFSTVILRAVRAVRVSGRVATAQGDTPCADGLVSLVASQPRALGSTAFIAPDGTVQFESVAPGTYHVSVDCSGYVVPSYAPLTVAEREVRGLTWLIDGGLQIRGRIVDSAGFGISTMVTATPHSGDNPSSPPPVQANAFGAFVITGLTPGQYKLAPAQEAEPFAIIDVIAGREPPPILLAAQPSASLDVTVRSPHALPVQDVVVSATAEDGRLFLAQSRGQGRFVFERLPSGNFVVSVDDGRSILAQRQIALDARRPLDVMLTTPSLDEVLSGRIVDDNGHPVSDAWVQVRGTDAQLPVTSSVPATLVSSDGSFTVTGLTKTTYDLMVSSPGGDVAHRKVATGTYVVVTVPSA
jgi:hypothetical protein